MGGRWVLCFLYGFMLAGCNVLPSDENHTKSPWSTFEEAKADYDLIIPNQTSLEDLKQLNYDPYTTPNITILTYVDIIKEFIPNQSIKVTDLDPALQKCIAVRERCFAYRIKPTKRHSDRHGNFLLDLLGFRKKTNITGWEFNAIVVIVDEKVVYKMWGGSPMSVEHKDSKKPLGPLQSGAIGDVLGF